MANLPTAPVSRTANGTELERVRESADVTGFGSHGNLNRDVPVIIGFCQKCHSDVGISYGRKL